MATLRINKTPTVTMEHWENDPELSDLWKKRYEALAAVNDLSFGKPLYGRDLAAAIFRALVVADVAGCQRDAEERHWCFTVKMANAEFETLDATDLQLLRAARMEVGDVQPIQEDPVG